MSEVDRAAKAARAKAMVRVPSDLKRLQVILDAICIAQEETAEKSS